MGWRNTRNAAVNSRLCRYPTFRDIAVKFVKLSHQSQISATQTQMYFTDRRTDRRTDRQTTNTLASRGLEEPVHALRGLEELFLQLCCCITTGKKSSSPLSGGLCCCVSFWFWRLRPEKKFLVVCLAGCDVTNLY